jgi:hypothetical protein
VIDYAGNNLFGVIPTRSTLRVVRGLIARSDQRGA